LESRPSPIVPSNTVQVRPSADTSTGLPLSIGSESSIRPSGNLENRGESLIQPNRPAPTGEASSTVGKPALPAPEPVAGRAVAGSRVTADRSDDGRSGVDETSRLQAGERGRCRSRGASGGSGL
jgi:hypothetical protein